MLVAQMHRLGAKGFLDIVPRCSLVCMDPIPFGVSSRFAKL